jgi:hypothetical protein
VRTAIRQTRQEDSRRIPSASGSALSGLNAKVVRFNGRPLNAGRPVSCHYPGHGNRWEPARKSRPAAASPKLPTRGPRFVPLLGNILVVTVLTFFPRAFAWLLADRYLMSSDVLFR